MRYAFIRTYKPVLDDAPYRYVARDPTNGSAVVSALRELGFALTGSQADEIASKAASNRAKDRESLPRLRAFRDYWIANRQSN